MTEQNFDATQINGWCCGAWNSFEVLALCSSNILCKWLNKCRSTSDNAYASGAKFCA